MCMNVRTYEYSLKITGSILFSQIIGKLNACANSVYQMLLPPLERLGMRLWCTPVWNDLHLNTSAIKGETHFTADFIKLIEREITRL